MLLTFNLYISCMNLIICWLVILTSNVSALSIDVLINVTKNYENNLNNDDLNDTKGSSLLQGIQDEMVIGDKTSTYSASSALVINLTRQHEGDIFWTNGNSPCSRERCMIISSGTATWPQAITNNSAGYKLNANNIGDGIHYDFTLDEFVDDELQPVVVNQSLTSVASLTTNLKAHNNNNNNNKSESCQCRCLPYLTTYREDLGICVDDIHECILSPFVSGSSLEKIPSVFLPLRGQIIYPSREINFSDIPTPLCAVTSAQYLTTNGWSDLRNPINSDYPFRIFRDESRIFLRWLGESDLRHRMQGRLILVHMVCRDMTIMTSNSTTTNRLKDRILLPKNVFSPCVAFRVNGSPVKYSNNVSEVTFQSEATSILPTPIAGITTKEYIVIGICCLLLGLIYVSSVFVYLHMRKRKTREQTLRHNSLNDYTNEINYPSNDQVRFGIPFAHNGTLYSTGGSMTASNEPRSRASISSLKDDIGIVKSNPLLKHLAQFNGNLSGFVSDATNSTTDCEMDVNFNDLVKQKLQTNILVHPIMNAGFNRNSSPRNSINLNNNYSNKQKQSATEEDFTDSRILPTQDNECLPMENVSIIEDMTEEKLENIRALVNGTVRKKLYFNPSYFDPLLLAQPPPAALEFLQKIREVIAIAKYKMASKRFQPSLIVIPEESQTYSAASMRSSQQQITHNTDCKACTLNRVSSHSKKYGSKRNTIEKWLQTVTTNESSEQDDQTTNAFTPVTPINGSTRSYKNNSNSNYPLTNITQGDKKNEIECNTSNSNNDAVRSPKRVLLKQSITAPKQKPPPPPPPVSKPIESQRHLFLDSTNSSSNSKYIKLSAVTQHHQYHSSSTSVCINNQTEMDAFLDASISNGIYQCDGISSEMYSNPKFSLNDSPTASVQSCSSSHYSKCFQKSLHLLDAYTGASTPSSLTSVNRQHYQMLRTMEQTFSEDNKHNAIETYSGTIKSNGSFQFSVPTPDYDSTMEKTLKDVYNNTQSSGVSVPTPDYSSLSLKSLKQNQPDSPIYHRKSPQYVIIDYETDSLERYEARRKTSQSSSPSSDISSQLSPSLSTALPLEEELEISHTVNKSNHNGKLKILNSAEKKTASTTDVDIGGKNIAARIKYDTPFRGSMTIEVDHEPPSDLERSTDSDQYEPDTLDRKPKKHSFCDVNAWSIGDNLKSPKLANNYQVLEYLTKSISLPNIHESGHDSQTKDLNRNLNAFQQSNIKDIVMEENIVTNTNSLYTRNLEDITASLVVCENRNNACKCGGKATTLYLEHMHEHVKSLSSCGRTLELESKHFRRQRQFHSEYSSERNSMAFSHSLPPSRASTSMDSTVEKQQNHSVQVIHPTYFKQQNYSENSAKFEKSNTVTTEQDNLNSKIIDSNGTKPRETNTVNINLEEVVKNEFGVDDNYGAIPNTHSKHPQIDCKLNKYKNTSKIDDVTEDSTKCSSDIQLVVENNLKNILESNSLIQEKLNLNGIILNTISQCNGNGNQLLHRSKDPIQRNGGVPVGIAYPQRSLSNSSHASLLNTNNSNGLVSPVINIPSVYRCEMESTTTCLKGRPKNTKDLKNAWKKFVSMAASKFSPTISPVSSLEKKSYHHTIHRKVKKDEIIVIPMQNYNDNTFGRHDAIATKDPKCASKNLVDMQNSISYESHKTVEQKCLREKNISKCDNDNDNNDIIDDDDVERLREESENQMALGRMSHSEQTSDDDDSDRTVKNLHKNHDSLEGSLNSTILQMSEEDDPDDDSYIISTPTESDGDTNVEDMWESGAESVETHSVLYKNIKNNKTDLR